MKALSLFQRTCIITITTALASVVCLAALESEDQIKDSEAFTADETSKPLKAPTILEVKKAVGKLGMRESNAVTLYTRSFNVDTPEGIRELFARCRDVDKQVEEAGKSVMSRQFEKLTSDSRYMKTYGVTTLEGKYFRIVGPKKIISLEKGRKVAVDADALLKSLLDKADATFEKAVSDVLMQHFINWSETKGTIYVIPTEKVWTRIRPTSMKNEIVQTVVPNDETRELFIYINPQDQDFAGQALGYAVAAQANREYTLIITGKPDAAMPTFFITGISANAGGLEAVITEEGPLKVKEVTVLGKKLKIDPKKGTKPPPLKKKQLIPLDLLTVTKGYPVNTEGMYYFLRQSSVLLKDLQEKAPLSFIALGRKLAEGKKFNKEIGLSYMEMQRSIEGREILEPQKNKDGDRVIPIEEIDYKRFSRYAENLFYKLTEEHLDETLKDKRQKNKEAAKEKNAAQAVETPSEKSK